MKSVKPKKSLGQNFLIDQNIQRKIIKLLDCRDNQPVIEIGPGTGALTRLLAAADVNLLAVEIDKRSFDALTEEFPRHDYPNIRILEGNILEYSLHDLLTFIDSSNASKVLVVGNLPYYISSEILFWLLESSSYVEKAVLTLQREVAERLTAEPRTKDYGILTVALSLLGSCRKMFDISPDCFYPKPKVWSSVVEIKFDKRVCSIDEFNSGMKLIRAAFNQRRKMLKNSLKTYIESRPGCLMDDFLESLPKQAQGLMNQRAEELLPMDFCKLEALINEYWFSLPKII